MRQARADGGEPAIVPGRKSLVVPAGRLGVIVCCIFLAGGPAVEADGSNGPWKAGPLLIRAGVTQRLSRRDGECKRGMFMKEKARTRRTYKTKPAGTGCR